MLQVFENLLLDLLKIHSFHQAVCALLLFHSILQSPHNCKHFCQTLNIHYKWNPTSWLSQMYFLIMLLLIVPLNSVPHLLLFLFFFCYSIGECVFFRRPFFGIKTEVINDKYKYTTIYFVIRGYLEWTKWYFKELYPIY